MPSSGAEAQPLLLTAAPPPTRYDAILITSRLRIASMCCPKEADLVQELLQPLPGVVDVKISVVGRAALVKHRSPAMTASLLEVLNRAHLGASVQHVEDAAQEEGADGSSGGGGGGGSKGYRGRQQGCCCWGGGGGGGMRAVAAAAVQQWGPVAAASIGLALAIFLPQQQQQPRPAMMQWAAVAPFALLAFLPLLPGLQRAVILRRADMGVLMSAAVLGALLLGDLVRRLWASLFFFV